MKNRIFSLGGIKSTFTDVDSLRMTLSARQGIVAAGLTSEDVVVIIQSLERENFYKSMVTDTEKRLPNQEVWQDVYYVQYQDCHWYMKFMANEDGFYLVSFKKNFRQLS